MPDPEPHLEQDCLTELNNLASFKVSNDPDTMCHHKAVCQLDAQQFKDTMVKEVNNHANRKHWKVMLKKNVPKGEIILPPELAMKHKQCISTREVHK